MSDEFAIKSITLEGMHGHQSCSLHFKPGLNIIYGKNGTGKTTLLHSIVNLLENDIQRFLFIRFEKMELHTYNGDQFVLIQERREHVTTQVHIHLNGNLLGTITRDNPIPSEITTILSGQLKKRPVYLPAYRSILEDTPRGRRHYRMAESEVSDSEHTIIAEREWLYIKENRSSVIPPIRERELVDLIAYKTLMCRSWFGEFVPVIRYPSIGEVHRDLEREIEKARDIVAAQDEKNISTVFRNVLEVVLTKKQMQTEQNTGLLLDRVSKAILDLQSGAFEDLAFMKEADLELSSSDIVKGILKVYDDALSSRSENKEKAYSKINRYISSVNRFLAPKGMGYEYSGSLRRSMGKSFVTLPSGQKASLNVLSSGERHIVSLLFAATHMSSLDGIVVIDEPELSLHVDWQRIILSEIQKQADGRQIIACTHSPEVAAEHEDCYIELVNVPVHEERTSDEAEQTEIDLEG